MAQQSPLENHIATYLELLFEKPRTQRTYAVGLRAFLAFLTEVHSRKAKSSLKPQRQLIAKHELTLEMLDAKVLEEFKNWLGRKDLSRFSRRTYLASVSAFLNYALSQDWMAESFSLERARAKLKIVKESNTYPIPSPDPALPRLIAYFDDLPLPEGDSELTKRKRLQILRDRAFVHLLYSSAGRLNEIASLSRKDVADGRRKETIVYGKGDKQRYIFITHDARAAILRYISERKDLFEPLFISHGRKYGARFTKMSLWRTISRAAKKLAMDVSPHDFRHFRARQMLEQGAPLEAIQEILGHTDIGTTRRVYAHYSKPAIRSIFERTTLSPQEAARKNAEQEAAE